MLRIGFLLVAAYTYGHDDLRDLRPEVLDRPMAQFRSDVDQAMVLVGDPLSKFNFGDLRDPVGRLAGALDPS